jgi:hypothetical protein
MCADKRRVGAFRDGLGSMPLRIGSLIEPFRELLEPFLNSVVVLMQRLVIFVQIVTAKPLRAHWPSNERGYMPLLTLFLQNI